MNEPKATNTFTTALELEGLLSEWAEIAPEECTYEENDAGELVCWYVKGRDGLWKKATIIAGIDEDRVLGAVMVAVEAKGWLVNLSSDNEDDIETGVMIYTGEIKAPCLGAADGLKWYSGEPDNSPVIALLLAYLKALKEVS